MITNDQMTTLAQSHHIEIETVPLPDKISGFFHSDGYQRKIIMNQSIEEDLPLYRSVLAEEFGHFFTSIGQKILLKNQTYSEKIRHDREEEKAIRWAAEYLIPTKELLHTIDQSPRIDLDEIIDHFQVTSDLMEKKLSIMALKKGYWKLASGRYLCLAAWPSVYVFNSFDNINL